MKTRRWIIALSLVLASACEGSSGGEGGEAPTTDDGGDSQAPPVAEADYPATHAAVLCDLQAECGCEDPLADAECRALFEEALAAGLAPAQQAGLSYDPQCGAEAVDDVVQRACAGIRDVPPPDCAPCRPYHGSRLAGETCTAVTDTPFDDCDRGLSCGATGVCVDACVAVSEGEDCRGRSCEAGLFCLVTLPEDGGDSIAECVRSAAIGEACNVELECDAGLACSYSQVCIEWSGAQAGEPCEYGCDEGLLCEPMGDDGAYFCRPLRAEGEACSGAGECASGRCDTDVCGAEQAAACIG